MKNPGNNARIFFVDSRVFSTSRCCLPLLFEECAVTQKGDGPSAMVVKGGTTAVMLFIHPFVSLSSLCNYARPNEIITPSHIATAVMRGGQSDPNVSAS